jgi:hypothetical protein
MTKKSDCIVRFEYRIIEYKSEGKSYGYTLAKVNYEDEKIVKVTYVFDIGPGITESPKSLETYCRYLYYGSRKPVLHLPEGIEVTRPIV